MQSVRRRAPDVVDRLSGLLDLFAELAGRTYDLILSNPPYVNAEAVAAFPPEYAAEPNIAHAGGEDGLDVVRRILAEAGRHLTEDGALVVEIGTGRDILEAECPRLPFFWLDTADSEGEVFALTAKHLKGKGGRGEGGAPDGEAVGHEADVGGVRWHKGSRSGMRVSSQCGPPSGLPSGARGHPAPMRRWRRRVYQRSWTTSWMAYGCKCIARGRRYGSSPAAWMTSPHGFLK